MSKIKTSRKNFIIDDQKDGNSTKDKFPLKSQTTWYPKIANNDKYKLKIKNKLSVLYNQTYVSNAGSQFKHSELSQLNKKNPETVYQSNFEIAPAQNFQRSQNEFNNANRISSLEQVQIFKTLESSKLNNVSDEGLKVNQQSGAFQLSKDDINGIHEENRKSRLIYQELSTRSKGQIKLPKLILNNTSRQSLGAQEQYQGVNNNFKNSMQQSSKFIISNQQLQELEDLEEKLQDKQDKKLVIKFQPQTSILKKSINQKVNETFAGKCYFTLNIFRNHRRDAKNQTQGINHQLKQLSQEKQSISQKSHYQNSIQITPLMKLNNGCIQIDDQKFDQESTLSRKDQSYGKHSPFNQRLTKQSIAKNDELNAEFSKGVEQKTNSLMFASTRSNDDFWKKFDAQKLNIEKYKKLAEQCQVQENLIRLQKRQEQIMGDDSKTLSQIKFQRKNQLDIGDSYSRKNIVPEENVFQKKFPGQHTMRDIIKQKLKESPNQTTENNQLKNLKVRLRRTSLIQQHSPAIMKQFKVTARDAEKQYQIKEWTSVVKDNGFLRHLKSHQLESPISYKVLNFDQISSQINSKIINKA